MITFAKEKKKEKKKKKEKGEGQHMDSCIHVYEPVLLYKLWLHKLIVCWFIVIKIIIK